MNRRAAAIAALEARIGHVFTRRDLLERALTHASVSPAAAAEGDNETLEFLGDRVLGLLAAEALALTHPAWREGELSRRLAALVSGPACGRIARRLGLGPALRLAPGASRQGGRDNDRILGDAMEALMAAVYLDGGLAAARALFADAWREALVETALVEGKDPKTALQEWAMARGLALPAYTEARRTGAAHAPRFVVSVALDGHAAAGEGTSLKAAQMAAALAFLEREGRGE